MELDWTTLLKAQQADFIERLKSNCPGEVFTSPTPDRILAAAKAVNSGAGVLNIVKNYSGDVMNFELAALVYRSRK